MRNHSVRAVPCVFLTSPAVDARVRLRRPPARNPLELRRERARPTSKSNDEEQRYARRSTQHPAEGTSEARVRRGARSGVSHGNGRRLRAAGQAHVRAVAPAVLTERIAEPHLFVRQTLRCAAALPDGVSAELPGGTVQRCRASDRGSRGVRRRDRGSACAHASVGELLGCVAAGKPAAPAWPGHVLARAIAARRPCLELATKTHELDARSLAGVVGGAPVEARGPRAGLARPAVAVRDAGGPTARAAVWCWGPCVAPRRVSGYAALGGGGSAAGSGSKGEGGEERCDRETRGHEGSGDEQRSSFPRSWRAAPRSISQSIVIAQPPHCATAKIRYSMIFSFAADALAPVPVYVWNELKTTRPQPATLNSVVSGTSTCWGAAHLPEA